MAQEIDLKKQNPDDTSPLNLAFIGDAVYELIIRNRILTEYNGNLKKINSMTSALTRATTQNKIMLALEKSLSEDEMRMYKRGRNAKSASIPKSCTVSEYRHATGFETLIGYLYLKNETKRILELVEQGIKAIEDLSIR